MNEYNRIIEVVRQHGERLTIQRQRVIEALTSTGAHMTINDVMDDIVQRYPEPALSEATIYRVVQWLKDLGLVSQTDLAAAGTVYQVIGARRHHHLVCLNCGTIIDIDDNVFDDLRAALRHVYHFQARIDHMAVYGHCADCADTQNPL